MTQQDTKALTIGLGVVVAIAVVVGAGIYLRTGNTEPTTTASPVTTANATIMPVATSMVNISNYAFDPPVITVKVGTAVTWTNQDAVNHSVTSDTGNTLTSPLFGRDGTFNYTFSKLGTYTYHCTPHPYMKATVIVTN